MSIETSSAVTSSPALRSRVRAHSAATYKWWAGFGAVCLLFQIGVIGAWLASNDLTRTPNGPTPIPGWHKAIMFTMWPLSILLFLFCIYWFIVRSWRRERRFSTDALIGFALLTLWFHDPICDFFKNWVTFTTVLPSWSNWAPHIPGWQAGTSMSVPVVVTPSVYLYWALPVMVLSCWLMRRAKQRWPNIGPLQLLAMCWSVNFAFDLLAEIAWVRTGYYVYPGATRALTLFHGKYYQLPLYFPMAAAAILTGWAWLRFNRDDRGLTFVERGIDQGRTGTPRTRTFVSFLAIAGYMNLIMILTFDAPMALAGHYAQKWPADIRSRSYLTDNLCRPQFQLCPSLLPAK
jgi:Spirocyclase AveC-like